MFRLLNKLEQCQAEVGLKLKLQGTDRETNAHTSPHVNGVSTSNDIQEHSKPGRSTMLVSNLYLVAASNETRYYGQVMSALAVAPPG